MLVAVTGASGLIGTAVVRRLQAEGHQVLRLTRSRPSGPDQVQWDPMAGRLDPDALAKADAVVHLAARNIGDQLRWTAATKRDLLQTRVEGTGLVAETMAGLADPARAAGLRVVHLRTGPVQTAAGAGLPKQALMFRLGIGGRLGSGRQWLSWISLDDIAGAYLHALTREDLDGPVNAVAPSPVTNAEFTATLARILGRPAVLHVPAFGPRLVLGEAADELLFVSQRARPARLQATGYRFQFPELEPALRHTLGRG
jgi:NAD dependent epimerase/dehydratase family enzyme